jgi:hypothetical protein
LNFKTEVDMALTLRSALFMQVVGGCPREVDELIRGWGTHKDTVALLPKEEQDKVAKIAELVVTSFTTPGCVPLGQITVVGHADKDANGPAFEQKISDERAKSVSAAIGKAIADLFRSRNINRIQKGAIAFDQKGVGATVPDPSNVPHVIDFTKNRRVEVRIRSRGTPVQPPPDPKTETAERLGKAADVLKRREMPSGRVQSDRVRCIFNKLKDNPNVNDRFVDGELNIITLRGKSVNGLQEVNRNYGPLTTDEREVFFSNAKPIVLSSPGFAKTASDDDVIRAVDALDRRILKAIGFLDAHLGINGISSDSTKVLLNDEITRLQGDANSIYSCR